MKRLIIAAMLSLSFASKSHAQSEIPNLPLPDDLLQYLDDEGIIELTSDGFHVENGMQPKALAKVSGCCGIMKFFRGIARPFTNVTEFVYDGLSVVVSSTTDGIKWTVDKATDGVSYVVEQYADGTRWTINTAIDGTRLVVRQTANVLSWSMEKSIPDGISFGGKTYLDFDPVKNTLQAGIRIPAKAINKNLQTAQSGVNYMNNLTKDIAVGVLDAVDGVTYISMDVVTFAATTNMNIGEKMASLDVIGALGDAMVAVMYAVSNTLGWGDLGWCGSISSGIQFTLPRRAFISDYWPPDEALSNLLLPTTSQPCRLFGLARLYKGCAMHDYCYGVPGKTKSGCDQEILQDWKNSCRDAFGSGWCYSNCEANVKLYHFFLAGADAKPYTDAQARSATDAIFRNEQIDKYNYYVSKYRNEGSNEYNFSKPVPQGFVPRPLIVPFAQKQGSPAMVPINSLLLN